MDSGHERGKGVGYPNSIDTVIELRGSNTKKQDWSRLKMEHNCQKILFNHFCVLRYDCFFIQLWSWILFYAK